MDSVRLRFLGSGDAFSSGGRFQACFHLDGGEEPVLLDCGATALVALKRERIDPASIGCVALSHLHGDHFGGLSWLILDGRFAGRTRPLMVAGPPSSKERFERASDALYPGATVAELPFAIRFVELADRIQSELGPALVTPFEVVHGSGAPAFALRIEYEGKVIAYSGDTEWTDSLIDAARGADLFVCECNFFEQPGPGHLDYKTLVSKRSELDCERLVLTHMGEGMLARLDDLEIETAFDGLVIAI